MQRSAVLFVGLVACATAHEPSTPWRDQSAHAVRFVDTNGARIEALDWGGNGPPIVLVPGMGNSAHIYDDFAPALTDLGHVVGVSRRGAGESKVTNGDYAAPTLADDVVRVMDAMHFERAHLIGHSFGGEELTWIGTHSPARVRSLVYLDAAYDHVALSAALAKARPGTPSVAPQPTAADLHDPVAYQAMTRRGLGVNVPLGEILAGWEFAPDGHFVREKLDNAAFAKESQGAVSPHWEDLRAPTLALYALVPRPGASPDVPALFAEQRAAFRKALPSAEVVELETRHYVFLTAREETLSRVRAFLKAH